MLKVASVISSLAEQCGGPVINLVDSVPYLRDAGVDVTIFTTDMGAPASAAAKRATPADFPSGAEHCDVRMVPARHPTRIAYAPDLRQTLRAELSSFDLVRIHGLYLHPQYVAGVEARREGVPYVITPHGALDPWVRRRGRMRKKVTELAWQDRMFRGAAAVHATTQTEADLFEDAVPSGPARRVVGNGVVLERFAALPPPGLLRAELGLDAHTPVVLFLGRISRKKGVDILLRAVAKMGRSDVALVIVGPDDEELRPGLERLASDLGIGQMTHFTGPKYGDDRLTALADSDIWVLPSHTENFGNAVLEAMAAGVPTVISTEVNLASEVLARGAGRVVPPEPGEFARVCADLLNDADGRRRLGSSGREFAKSYGWPKVARDLAEMFREFAR